MEYFCLLSFDPSYGPEMAFVSYVTAEYAYSLHRTLEKITFAMPLLT